MTNLFRQAAELLKAKDAGGELTEDELQLIATAEIPLMIRTNGLFNGDSTIAEGLEELAGMVDGNVKEGDKMTYPGRVKYVDCPLCGNKVKLISHRADWKLHGTCSQCGKRIIEDS